MNVRDVHDETTAALLLCLLLDFGDALQHTTTDAKCVHDPRSLKLHVVPSCRFVQHESLNHYVKQVSVRLVVSSSVHNS